MNCLLAGAYGLTVHSRIIDTSENSPLHYPLYLLRMAHTSNAYDYLFPSTSVCMSEVRARVAASFVAWPLKSVADFAEWDHSSNATMDTCKVCRPTKWRRSAVTAPLVVEIPFPSSTVPTHHPLRPMCPYHPLYLSIPAR
ncbi:hypothetical protein ARMGADRAFT_591788 [Armillaria gallica]|uniref:Uncharacterized protein n=1 Tax=Armillaria gallica TaxID=47427 RepID=A0A2H3CUH5_ARMGA|nr:hypothetical protein ARMGADRAFT_591788 [Armillaria gallica]